MDDGQALVESQLELETGDTVATGNFNYQPHALEDSEDYLMYITDSLIIAPKIAPRYPKEPGGHRNTFGTVQRGENKVRTINHRDRTE